METLNALIFRLTPRSSSMINKLKGETNPGLQLTLPLTSLVTCTAIFPLGPQDSHQRDEEVGLGQSGSSLEHTTPGQHPPQARLIGQLMFSGRPLNPSQPRSL